MKRWVIAICIFVPLFSSCGVNPERAKDMRITENESSSSAKATSMVKDADDPADIAAAIDSLELLSAAITKLDLIGVQESRNSILESLRYNANEVAATHPKTPLILEKVNEADRRLAEKLGTNGAPLLDVGREQKVSSDALQTFGEGVAICQTFGEIKTKDDVDALSQKMNQAFENAGRLDGNVGRYSGKDSAQNFVDHPFIYAVCRHSAATRAMEIGDLAPVFADLSSTYVGCGKFELNIAAKQEAKGAFGPYLLTNKSAFAEKAPVSERVECAIIPPVSDASKDIISLVKSNVQWLHANDILSMKGEFVYGEGEGGMTESGRVSVFRRDAELRTSACGAKDSVVVCSQQGNTVSLSFDLATHYIKRANVHRANGNAEGCRNMANKAIEFASKKLDYDGKLIYQTSRDKRLQPSEIKTKIETMKTEASTMSNSGWCQPNPNNK